MLANPLNISGRCPLQMNTFNLALVADGETTLVKRTQGIMQTVGRLAPSRGLIELRKLLRSEGRPGNVMGKAATARPLWQWTRGDSPEYEIVVCMKRSEINES